ncbi:MAG: chromosome condensation regulator RCC1, partial [Caulobacteraceae bacterium]|nr:chromosome condensation regulator RCC1 [Caulobacteraceae bacterium]
MSPVQIGSLSWTAVSGGRLHSLGLTNTNLLYVWGGNTVGQIGLGDSTVPSFATDPQAQVGLSWTSVSGGLDNTFGIKSDKSGWAWGSNTTGKLGDLSTISRSVPVRLPFLWNKIAAGVSHTVGITDGGLLYGWGGNSIGQLGDGTTTNKSSPVLIGSTSIYNDVSVLGTHTVAIRSDGLLFGWGLNNYGQLGDGTTNNKSSPVQIGSSSWASVSAGINHTLA